MSVLILSIIMPFMAAWCSALAPPPPPAPTAPGLSSAMFPSSPRWSGCENTCRTCQVINVFLSHTLKCLVWAASLYRFHLFWSVSRLKKEIRVKRTNGSKTDQIQCAFLTLLKLLFLLICSPSFALISISFTLETTSLNFPAGRVTLSCFFASDGVTDTASLDEQPLKMR